MSEKKNIRRESKAKVLALSPEQRREASAAIFRQVAESHYFRRARCVAAYISLSDEPQTEDFLAEICRLVRVVVPRVEGSFISFYDYRPDHLQRGAFGICEPDSDCTPCPVDQIDLAIVPGTAFTASGQRLGRGGGFYDRLLAHPDFRAATIGVCFDVQIVDRLPAEPYDRPVDMVVTEKSGK